MGEILETHDGVLVYIVSRGDCIPHLSKGSKGKRHCLHSEKEAQKVFGWD